MPCQPTLLLCPDLEPVFLDNLCKDEALEPLPIPTQEGIRITLDCNECFLYEPRINTKVICVINDGYCDPCCCKETTPVEPEVV